MASFRVPFAMLRFWHLLGLIGLGSRLKRAQHAAPLRSRAEKNQVTVTRRAGGRYFHGAANARQDARGSTPEPHHDAAVPGGDDLRRCEDNSALLHELPVPGRRRERGALCPGRLSPEE